MALSSAQRAGVRLYLGYSDQASGVDSNLERGLDDLSADAETLVGGMLTTLATVETRLSGLWTRASVTKAEEVSLDVSEGIRGLRAEGRRLVGRIASTLGVQVLSDSFGGGATGGYAPRG